VPLDLSVTSSSPWQRVNNNDRSTSLLYRSVTSRDASRRHSNVDPLSPSPWQPHVNDDTFTSFRQSPVTSWDVTRRYSNVSESSSPWQHANSIKSVGLDDDWRLAMTSSRDVRRRHGNANSLPTELPFVDQISPLLGNTPLLSNSLPLGSNERLLNNTPLQHIESTLSNKPLLGNALPSLNNGLLLSNFGWLSSVHLGSSQYALTHGLLVNDQDTSLRMPESAKLLLTSWYAICSIRVTHYCYEYNLLLSYYIYAICC